MCLPSPGGKLRRGAGAALINGALTYPGLCYRQHASVSERSDQPKVGGAPLRQAAVNAAIACINTSTHLCLSGAINVHHHTSVFERSKGQRGPLRQAAVRRKVQSTAITIRRLDQMPAVGADHVPLPSLSQRLWTIMAPLVSSLPSVTSPNGYDAIPLLPLAYSDPSFEPVQQRLLSNYSHLDSKFGLRLVSSLKWPGTESVLMAISPGITIHGTLIITFNTASQSR
ncbi:hypothetical protein B0H17DRAFT_1128601 [Mycena rosella]|uniref:Uncharacterized protein n=1 Tax=Mycena rosella TaxID=1033263 RepID=A0AAD7GPA5_MYCRO|nr:hypothetical protein B0H17DRAFT_1128601 [Mycena rosella]